MTYLYGHKVPRKIQKSLGVKQTTRFDDATRLAVQAKWGGTGKKINANQVKELESPTRDMEGTKESELGTPASA